MHIICSLFSKGHKIYDQQKRMGVSTDWDRESFTMSEVLYLPPSVEALQVVSRNLRVEEVDRSSSIS